MQYRTSRLIAGPALRTLARPEVTGMENVPTSGPAILASNHLSIIDSIFLPLMVPRPVTFAAKSEYFTGTAAARQGHRGLPARDQPAVH